MANPGAATAAAPGLYLVPPPFRPCRRAVDTPGNGSERPRGGQRIRRATQESVARTSLAPLPLHRWREAATHPRTCRRPCSRANEPRRHSHGWGLPHPSSDFCTASPISRQANNSGGWSLQRGGPSGATGGGRSNLLNCCASAAPATPNRSRGRIARQTTPRRLAWLSRRQPHAQAGDRIGRFAPLSVWRRGDRRETWWIGRVGAAHVPAGDEMTAPPG